MNGVQFDTAFSQLGDFAHQSSWRGYNDGLNGALVDEYQYEGEVTVTPAERSQDGAITNSARMEPNPGDLQRLEVFEWLFGSAPPTADNPSLQQLVAFQVSCTGSLAAPHLWRGNDYGANGAILNNP